MGKMCSNWNTLEQNRVNLTIASMHPKYTVLGVEISQDPLMGVMKEIGLNFSPFSIYFGFVFKAPSWLKISLPQAQKRQPTHFLIGKKLFERTCII